MPMAGIRGGSHVNISFFSKFKRPLQDGSGALGDISREDLARVLVECLQHSPKKALVFSVENRQDDAPEDLASQISRLRETVPV